MLIDWFTVVAQVLNFLILVWLLKRFLYKPVLLAIDTREKGIADQLALAATKQSDAQKQQDEFQSKNADFDKEKAALLTKATDEAKGERQKLIDQSRAELDVLRAQQTDTLNHERESVQQDLVKSTSREVYAIARKTLSDLASTGLEEQMANVFVQRLRGLSQSDKNHLSEGLKSSPGTASVRSVFELPAAQQSAISSAVNDATAMDAHVTFETQADLVSGIELTTTGYKVSWNAEYYLAEMEKSVDEALKGQHAS